MANQQGRQPKRYSTKSRRPTHLAICQRSDDALFNLLQIPPFSLPTALSATVYPAADIRPADGVGAGVDGVSPGAG